MRPVACARALALAHIRARRAHSELYESMISIFRMRIYIVCYSRPKTGLYQFDRLPYDHH